MSDLEDGREKRTFTKKGFIRAIITSALFIIIGLCINYYGSENKYTIKLIKEIAIICYGAGLINLFAYIYKIIKGREYIKLNSCFESLKRAVYTGIFFVSTYTVLFVVLQNCIKEMYISTGLFIILFALGFIFNVIFESKLKKYIKLFDIIEYIVLNLFLSFVLYIILAFIQRGSITSVYYWLTENSLYFAEGLCILFFISLILNTVINKKHISFGILAFIFTVFLIVNYFKIQFRNMPFFPWDFLLAGVMSSVVGSFKLSVPFAMIIGVILIIALFIGLFYLEKNKKQIKPGFFERIIVIFSSVSLLGFFMFNVLFNVDVNLFDAKNFYLERGFICAFFENMQYLKPIEEPKGYSKDKMEEIYNKIMSSASVESESKKPNVILLMSESFWDIRRVKELKFGEEIFPTYKRLKDTSLTGELIANVYGGGTVNSEFEALTGFSVAYLPPEYMPYQMCMRKNFFSVNSYLKSNGYESLFIHPFEKTNYNRDTVYEYLGFDKMLWEEDFDENSDRMRGYISDKELVKKIISEYENHRRKSSSPWFNLSVSMQNHGGYRGEFIDEGKTLDIDVSAFNENSQGAIKDLAIGLHYSDIALGELIDYFENIEEPTVIIMFGDHMTDAGKIGETMLNTSSLLYNNESEEESILEERRVPFMAWSNYCNVKSDCGIISITQLLPTVFSEYGIIMPEYFKYLKDTQNIYTACGSNIVVNKDDSCSFVKDMTPEQRKMYDEYWLIEYDYIYGENYLSDLFEYNKYKTN